MSTRSPADPTRPFDAFGAVLSAVGMFFVVFGILQADSNALLMVGPAGRRRRVPARGSSSTSARRERAGKEPLLSTGAVQEPHRRTSAWSRRTSSGCCSWASSFVVVGLPAGRCAATTRSRPASSSPRRRSASSPRRSPPSGWPSGAPQRTLIIAGFVVTAAGIVLLLGLVGASSRVVAFVPGLLLIGLGLGVMLTPSVNLVQSSFPEAAAGRDLGPVAQRLQPRLVVRHGDRRHDPGLRPRARATRPT